MTAPPAARPLVRMLLRRVLTGTATLLFVTAVIFWLAGIAPFDPVAAYLGAAQEWADPGTRARISAQLGVDDPWWQHYLGWARGVLTGDPGWSSAYRQPVGDVLGARLVWSVLLGAVALPLATLASAALALAAIRRPGGWVDRTVSALATVLAATPAFLVCLGLIAVVPLRWGWLPAGGLAPAGEPLTAGTVARHLILPAIALASSLVPWLVLHLRESMVEAYGSAAVSGARARGASEAQVLWGHVVPPALMPAVTVIAARLPELVTGTVLVETVFGWPGIGQALVRAATSVDYPLMAAVTLAAGTVVIGGNLLADLLQWRIDLRARGGLR